MDPDAVAPDATTAHEQPLRDDQRRLLLGICVLVAAISMVPATYNFVLNPMLEGLGATESQETLLRQLPSIAALVVIFLASTLGSRLGERRLIFLGSITLTAGCAVVGVAPALPVATVGLVLISTASSAMAVVGLGLLSSRITGPRARTTAFASYALVAPAVYMVLPVAAGFALDQWSWRLVAAMWTVGGMVLIASVHALLPNTPGSPKSGELLTPALAGVALAAGVQTVTAIVNSGLASAAVIVRAAIAIVAAGALLWRYRRGPASSISIDPLKRGGMLVLMVVVIVVPFVNLWFYMTLGYQYVFGMSALQTALLMVPPQLAGVFGALLARQLITKHGITRAGVALLTGLSITLVGTIAIVADTPIWLIVASMSAYALTSVGASVPVTNSIMNAAYPGEEGSASAFRGAAVHIGTALGVVVMSTIVFAAATTSFEDSLSTEGLATAQSAQIAEDIRDGATSEDVSALYAVPPTEVSDIDDAQKDAMIDGLHAHGLSGAIFIAVAAGIFWYARRRQVAAAT